MSILSNLSTEKRIFALFKGEPKTGKDIAAHSFAAAGPLYTLDLDGRMESVAYYYTHVVPRPDIVRNISYDRFSDFFSINNRLEELKLSCPYTTIVCSSLTSLARKAMNTMLETRDQAYLDKEQKSRSKPRGGIYMHILEDFGGEANAIMMTLGSLLTISLKFGVNVILTAHIINPEPGAYKATRTLLTGGKKIAAEIPTSFNEAYHFYVNVIGGMEIGGSDTEREYLCYTKPVGIDWASTALPLPDRINFTAEKTSGIFYEELMKYVRQANEPLHGIKEGMDVSSYDDLTLKRD